MTVREPHGCDSSRSAGAFTRERSGYLVRPKRDRHPSLGDPDGPLLRPGLVAFKGPGSQL